MINDCPAPLDQYSFNEDTSPRTCGYALVYFQMKDTFHVPKVSFVLGNLKQLVKIGYVTSLLCQGYCRQV